MRCAFKKQKGEFEVSGGYPNLMCCGNDTYTCGAQDSCEKYEVCVAAFKAKFHSFVQNSEPDDCDDEV